LLLSHIVAALQDIVECIGIEPDTLAIKHLNLQFAFLKEPLVDIENLIATMFGRHNLFGNILYLVGEDIEAGDGIVMTCIHIAHDAQRLAVLVHHHTSVLIFVRLILNKDGCIAALLDSSYRLLDLRAKVMSINNVIASYKAHAILASEISCNIDSVSYSIGVILDCVCDLTPELLAIAYRLTEHRLLLPCGDDKQLGNTSFDKDVYWIIDHQLVINLYQLLVDAKGKWMEA
jgi:hypothetical protein